MKIQNEKMQPLPDPFSLDWDNLSETELKRLVGQLERTRSDLKSDLREMEWRLDKEGREYHHFDDFCRMYQAEIKNLNRILESLVRTGVIPGGFQLSLTGSQVGVVMYIPPMYFAYTLTHERVSLLVISGYVSRELLSKHGRGYSRRILCLKKDFKSLSSNVKESPPRRQSLQKRVYLANKEKLVSPWKKPQYYKFLPGK